MPILIIYVHMYKHSIDMNIIYCLSTYPYSDLHCVFQVANFHEEILPRYGRT